MCGKFKSISEALRYTRFHLRLFRFEMKRSCSGVFQCQVPFSSFFSNLSIVDSPQNHLHCSTPFNYHTDDRRHPGSSGEGCTMASTPSHHVRNTWHAVISLASTTHRSRVLQAKVIVSEVVARVEELLMYHG